MDAIGKRLDDKLKSVEQFTIKVGGLGAFPNRSKPRVVWLGLEPHDGPLSALREAVETAVEEAGWPRENRKFSAHLTLGRVKSLSGTGKLRRVLERDTSLPVGTMPVERVDLIKSTLTPKGPVYETLATTSLWPR